MLSKASYNFRIFYSKAQLFIILAIALFFRIYNFQNLQYWSEDEEIAAAFVRSMITNHKISLVSHNYAVNAPLGSFFHILSVPVFYLTGMNPALVLMFMGTLGVLTAYLIYKIGVLIADEKLGFLASLIYSASFVFSLADRRWWPLSLNPLLVSLAIFSIIKILKKEYKYLIFLAPAIGFSWHADPTLALIAFATLVVFFVFKVPIFRKELLVALLVITLFLLPLLLFEMRHPGSLVNPYLRTFFVKTGTFNLTKNITVPNNPVETISHIIFPNSTNFAENYLCYCNVKGLTFFPLLSIPVTIFLLCSPLLELRKRTMKKNIIVLYIFLLTFFASALIYIVLFKNAIYDHYYTIAYPVFSLLLAISLWRIKNRKILFWIFLSFYLLVNTKALFRSSLKYPLSDKELLTKRLINYLGSSPFSLYAPNENFIHNGGFTGLFTLNNHPPVYSYIYNYHDYIFTAYDLYPIKPDRKAVSELVLILDKKDNISNLQNIKFETTYGNLTAIILKSDSKKFNYDSLEDIKF